MASPRTFPSDDDCRAFLRTRGLPGLACVDQTADEAFTSFGVRRRIAWYMMNHAPDGVANVRLRTVDDGRLCWVACRAITLHEELTWCYGGAGCVPSSWGQKARRVLNQRRGRPSPPASIRRELLGDVAATHCLRALHLGSCGGDPAEDVNTMLVRAFRSARSSAAPAMPPPPPPSLLSSPADRRPPPLPPPPPSRAAVSASASSLQAASAYYAKARAAALAHGGGSMALRADLATILDVGERLDEYATFGVNAGTAKKDARAWSMWVSVCRRLGTEPLRTAEEARTRPERNAYLLACLMLHAFAIGKPRDAAREFIKPRSALAYPLAIMRVFKRWGIQMPSYQMLVAELQGLSRLYVQYHGPHSMAPRRAEPMKFSMVASINAITDVQVGRWWWSDRDHLVFTFRRLNLVLMRTAFRLGEVSSHASGEVMYLTFACLTWIIDGIPVADPTSQQLAALVPGRDVAQLAPPRSKPDQWGEIHCPFPVTLGFDSSPDSGASALRDLELRASCHGLAREATALFGDERGRPYSHAVLDQLLRAVLTHLYGAAIAGLYTFHSYRSGLAVALHAVGCPDPMIQLICRWMCPESLHVYRRMGTQEHASLVEKASHANVQVIQATNIPRVSNDQGYAALLTQLTGQAGPAARSAFEIEAAALQPAPSPRASPAVAPSARVAERGPSCAALRGPRLPPGLAAPPAPLSAPLPSPPSPSVPPPPLLPGYVVGRAVLVPRSVYPRYPCAERGGAGWEATVLSATSRTAVVRYAWAATAQGRPYEDVRIPLRLLQPL